MRTRIADYLIRIASWLLDRDIKIIPKDAICEHWIDDWCVTQEADGMIISVTCCKCGKKLIKEDKDIKETTK